jgi:integrase
MTVKWRERFTAIYGVTLPRRYPREPQMPTRKLTDLFVERVKPPDHGRVEYFDAAFPGLALRLTDNGGKSWCVFYRFKGRLRRFTIGRYPALKPAQARREAQAVLERVREAEARDGGIDPADQKRARRGLRDQAMDTFGIVVADYLERYARRNLRESTYFQAKRDLEFDAVPAWRNRPVGSIARRDVVDLIDRIIERGAPIQANRTLARLRALFNWAIEKDRLAASPIARMKLPTQEQSRDRVLSDEELRWLWRACDDVGWPFGPLAKFLMLTAQRRDEAASMAWPEIDFDERIWTIPRERAKNDRAHEVQLSDAAIATLRSLPRVGDSLIFTTTGETAVSGFSRAKRRLDAAMLAAKRADVGERKGEAIQNWTLHDLRRTAATGMARLNFPPHVVDKVLNHASGTIKGVAAVYNRFAYLEERRAALEAWGWYVESLVAPAPANVVSIRR